MADSTSDSPAVRPERDRNHARIEAATRALRALIRETYLQRFGHGSEPGPSTLDLRMTLDPSADWAVRFDPPLTEQVFAQLEVAQAKADVFQQGRVYCFRCETSACTHAVPSSSEDIFEHYDPLGSPRWRNFAQHLLDHGDERVERVFEARPELVSCYVRGRDLRDQQLAAFGKTSKTYAILGQLMVGYLRLPVAQAQDVPERLALTFQAVQIKDRSGRSRVELNTVLCLPNHLTPEELWTERFDWVARAQAAARESFARLNRQLAERPVAQAPELLSQVPHLLRQLGADVERGKRQQQRQTQHARDRKLIQRPVDKAMADLREARADHFFRDAKTQAIVLHAEKGRCHVFNEAGRHVTSFVIPTESVRQRLSRKRWVELDRELYQRFLAQVAGQSPENPAQNPT